MSAGHSTWRGPGGPHPRPIWPRVNLDVGADVVFSGPGLRQEVLAQDRLDELFSIGLQVAPDELLREGDVAADLTLRGRGSFLIGLVDVGVELGMEVLARGLTYVLSGDVGLRPRVEADGPAVQVSPPQPEEDSDERA